MNQTFFERASLQRFALFPCRAGTKTPILKWKEGSSFDVADWTAWQAAGHNLAIDAAKSNLVVLDVDASKVTPEQAWAAWHALCLQWGFSGAVAPMTASARGGWHIPFQRPSHLQATDLRGGGTLVRISEVRPLADGEKDGEVIGFKNRGYCVAPGSYLETPSGNLPYAYMGTNAPVPHVMLDPMVDALRLPVVERAVPVVGEWDHNEVLSILKHLHNIGHEYVTPGNQNRWKSTLAVRNTGIELSDDLFEYLGYESGEDSKFFSRWEREDRGSDNNFNMRSLKQAATKTGWNERVQKSTADMFGPILPMLADAPPLAPIGRLIQSSGEFVANFVAPSYLLDGILQRRFCYALTAATGAGKTAIALLLTAYVALGRKLGDRDVERGRVLYFASENYVDVQARWIAMAQHLGFDVNAIDVHFVSGATKLSEIADKVTAEANVIGDLALVIVDTSTATFEGTDENSNVDGLQHAKRMRSLTELRGGPTVLVLCHPTKNATTDNLIPRGGGSFIAEIDGNLCARKSDSAVELHWAGKFRGVDFAPMTFRLDTVTAQRLKDARGRDMPTVMATPMDEASRQALAESGRCDEDLVLRAIDEHPQASSSTDIAKALGWKMRDGRPYGVKVRRAAEKLAGDGLIMKHRGAWALTKQGEKELNKLDFGKRNYALTPPGTTAVPLLAPFPGASGP